jgi:arylsulfatase A-like enzyme
LLVSEAESKPFWLLIARFALVGATLGLVAGLCEAALLYSTPAFLALFHPQHRQVIWFLAPLVDLIFYGVSGFALGLACALAKRFTPWTIGALTALLVGVAGAHVIFLLELLRGHGRAYRLESVSVFFGLVVACLLVALKIGWRYAGRHFDAAKSTPVRVLASVVLGATVILALGLAYCLIPHLRSRDSVQASAPPAVTGPNIILVTLDTTRADHLSPYGYSRPTTPNLDRLARHGVLFENAVAPSSWTLASHASIFTGLLPHQHGANWGVPLSPSSLTLAQILQSNGYETAGFSANCGFGSVRWGMAHGYGLYQDFPHPVRDGFAPTLIGRLVERVSPHLTNPCPEASRRSASDVNTEVFGWFQSRSNRPFLLFINYFDPHAPYIPPPGPYQRRFGLFPASLGDLMDRTEHHTFAKLVSDSDRAALLEGYDNTLGFLDERVGSLMQFLADSLVWSNTVVIITADHGEAFGEHGTYNHGWDLYREVLHVPLIILGAGIPAGRRVKSLVDIRDIFATVLDLAQVRPGRNHVSGSTLRRFWSPELDPQFFDRDVISELYRSTAVGPDAKDSISLTTNEWHYLRDSNGQVELYRYPVDPQEAHNLAGSTPEYERTAAQLHARLCEAVVSSLNPLQGREYLGALNEINPSSPRQTVLGCGLESKLPLAHLPGRLSREEEELIKSLPYN